MRTVIPTLSLCMIVRDNASTIKPCLESIFPWVDELIVVDTGSLDDTPSIARSYGAKVFTFPWIDDFSAARNESIRHARGEWLFWMDSDDTIPAACGEEIRRVARGNHIDNTLGYVVQVRCPGPTPDEFTTVDHVKLFRNHPAIRFEFRIHEQLLPSIRRQGGDVGWTKAHVVHSGSDPSDTGRAKKYVRDLRILELELQERPEHPFALFNFGMTYADMNEHETAITYLERSLAASSPGESHLRKVYAILANSLTEIQEKDRAWDVCQESRKLFPEDRELLFRHAMLCHGRGDLAEAEASYLKTLSEQQERHFASYDQGIVGFKARHNLALVYGDMGRHDLSEVQWRQVLRRQPRFLPAWQGMIDLLLERGHVTVATEATDRMKQQFPSAVETLVVEAGILQVQGSVEEAREMLSAVYGAHPDNDYVSQKWSRFLFEHGPNEEAIKFFELRLDETSTDPALAHNLAVLYLNNDQTNAAIDMFYTSLRWRPDYLPTMQQLSAALSKAGRSKELETLELHRRTLM